MKKVTPLTELKNAIQLLEEEQAIKGKHLKEQFLVTYYSFKPAKLLGGTLKEMVTSPFLVEQILKTVLSIGTGYLAKKILIGTSGNIIRKLIGSVLQLGVANIVSKNVDTLGSFGKVLFKHFLRKKENKP